MTESLRLEAGRVLAIVNPTAGRGAAARAWKRVGPLLKAEGLALEVAITTEAGHATELARAAAHDGARAVIAVGGDGTVHEVANGLLGAAAGSGGATVPMAIIPAGSGNDFVKQLGIPADADRAARLVTRGIIRQVDAGRVAGIYFVNGVGVGFDARVAMEARSIRWLRGTPLYALALLRVLRSYRAPLMRVEIDGREVRNQQMTLVTIANGPCCGGGFWLCPAARLDDGLLEVLVADRTSRRRILRMLGSALRAKHLGREGVEIQRGKSVKITGDTNLPIHADGEIVSAGLTAEVKILPGLLTVIAPAGPPEPQG